MTQLCSLYNDSLLVHQCECLKCFTVSFNLNLGKEYFLLFITITVYLLGSSCHLCSSELGGCTVFDCFYLCLSQCVSVLMSWAARGVRSPVWLCSVWCTSERWGLAEGAILVVEVGGAVAGAKGRWGRQDQLLFDDAGLGMVLWQLCQSPVQRVPQQVQPLRRLAQTRLRLHSIDTEQL